MRLRSYSMRKWTLSGFIPAALFACIHPRFFYVLHTAWFLFGLIHRDPARVCYQRRIGPWREGARAFFAWIYGAALFAIFIAFGRCVAMFPALHYCLYWIGAAAFANALTAILQNNRLNPVHAFLFSILPLLAVLYFR